MIKNILKTINKAMFSPIFKCNHDFIYYCCTPKQRYCKKCQVSQVLIDTWVDSDSQKAISKRNDSQSELDLKKRELRDKLEVAQQRLDKEIACQLADKEMLNADPRRIFDRTKSIKKHYKIITNERIIEEYLREIEKERMSSLCKKLRFNAMLG